ncbi:hypothetical protein ACMU_17305 [Actibacterium mucosum KCTC 23349]|uniref:Right handed beta helix domain-containing protein n=1 Tax=Actibacterium mucosum KCTC 23349 TaxID=1454373 RepID=A0A037ZG23_9RHOB|nr:hypothetical protein [Actibacterium mucosum]KAJ54466.1 hypothetical protein ACMU_17305 [Actibacterium mucosum KCTC 23349]
MLRNFAILAALAASPVVAQDIYVAPRGSAAYDAAKAMDGVKVERTIHKALGGAATLLQSCGDCTVTIHIAGGDYDGKAGTGQWFLPEVKAPGARLRILGGYNDDFTARTPFATPTRMITPPERSATVLRFEGKKHALAELVVSGLAFDVSPSNNYERETNSLMFGGSSTWGVLQFGYLETDLLVIADNTFLNAPAGVGGPAIRAASPGAVVQVSNNIFMNNVFTWQVEAGGGKHLPTHKIAGNSFVLNWPRNPDQTTSNPGTLQIGSNYSGAGVEITGNLFAYNVGGAIFPQWDEDRGPPMTITDNLFFGNGALFGAEDPGQGALVGKFNGSATHSIFDHWDLEDEFDWDSADNTDIDPEVAVPVLEIGALKMTLDRGTQESEPKAEPATTTDDDLGLDLDMLDTGLGELSLDIDFDMDDMADGDGIRNFAPVIPFDIRALPFPRNPAAEGYGASPDRIYVAGQG